MLTGMTESVKVTVEIFKPSGKWYSTAKVDMRPFSHMLIHDALFEACMAEYTIKSSDWGLVRSPNDYLADGWMLVCVDPDHPHAHPIMLRNPRSE